MGSSEPPSRPLRALQGFGRFFYDFLIGDTPELFVGTLAALGVVALLSVVEGWNALAAATLPLLVIAMLVGTVLRARRSAPSPNQRA